MAQPINAIRHYEKRDSATAALRKLGIKKEQYDEYIKTKVVSGVTIYETDLPAAEQYLLDVGGAAPSTGHPAGPKWPFSEPKGKAPAPKTQLKPEHAKLFDEKISKEAKARPGKNEDPKLVKKAIEKPVKEAKAGPESVSAAMRRLVLEGKTNDEVWAVCKKLFKLDDSKKGYPAWYRNQLKKSGQLK